MPEPVVQDYYVPHFEVKVSNHALPKDVIYDITSVTYKDSIDEIDSFEVTINNWDARTLTFKYSDKDIFDPGASVDLSMGYFGQGRTKRMLSGSVTSLRPSFPSGGQPTLVVGGVNEMHRLRTKQVSCSYFKKTDSQIAKQIGSRLGIKVITDPAAEAREVPYEYVIQKDRYDILFLMDRARHIDYDLVMDQNGDSGKPALHFKPSDSVNQVTFNLTYGRTLIEFQPNLSTNNQVSKVQVNSWDDVNKRVITATATRGELSTKGVGAAGHQGAIDKSFQDRTEVIARHTVQNEQEAKTLALDSLERNAKQMLTGSGSTIGLPDLRAGTVLFLDGLGQRFSGRYFVTGTTHTIGDSGYTTQFECRREELKG